MRFSTAIRALRQREYGLAIMIGLTVLLVSIVDSNFLSGGNLRDNHTRSAPTAIVACGVMLVIVTGEIDISVGSLMALLAAVMGLLLSRHHAGLSLWIGIPATLLLGTACGLITGLLVTLGRIPSIIVTLGLLTAFRGVTTLVMRGQNIDGLPEELCNLAKFGVMGLPLSVWVAGGVVALTAVLIALTPLGRRLYAVGSSRYSAGMLGLSEIKLKVFAFAFTGFLTGLATLVDIPRLPYIEAGVGVGFELLVVTCVVVGGVSISGGRGRLGGVLLAVLFMTMVRPVLTFLDVGEAGEKWTRAIQGLFIMLAVATDSLLSRRPHYHHGPRPQEADA